MKTASYPRQIASVVSLLAGVSSAAQAATYENTVEVGTPFSVTLDSGSTAWEMPSASLGAVDSGLVEGSYYYWTNTEYVIESIPAQVGVDGAINLYKEKTQQFYDYSYQTQSFDASYSAHLSGPSAVPQTYTLTGQIENLIGTALVNGGEGDVWFDMGLTPEFAEPYVPGSGSATLSFRFGTAPAAWSYSYEKTFDLSPSSISLSDYISESWADVDLSGMAYFEATYTIAGTSGVMVDGSSLYLDVWGAAQVDSQTYTHSVVERELMLSEAIPALSPVPETETYAMMLAGLGLVGFVTRRRMRTAG